MPEWKQTVREADSGRKSYGLGHCYVLPNRALCGFRPRLDRVELEPVPPDDRTWRSCDRCVVLEEPYV